MKEERHRRLEFSTTAINILNSLEHMGYRVVTSGSFVASQCNNNNKVCRGNKWAMQSSVSSAGKQAQVYPEGICLDNSPQIQ